MFFEKFGWELQGSLCLRGYSEVPPRSDWATTVSPLCGSGLFFTFTRGLRPGLAALPPLRGCLPVRTRLARY